MAMKTAYSEHKDEKAAAAEIADTLNFKVPTAVLFFASSAYDPQAIAKAVGDALPMTTTLGCTTAGELVDRRMLSGSLVACGLYDDDLEACQASLIADPADEQARRKAFAAIASAADDPLAPDPSRHVGIVLQDGMLGTEEAMMNTLSSISNVPFVGGSAGDDRAFEHTHVFLNGQAMEGGAVLLMLRPKRPFAILKTQSFDVQDRVLTATEVDEASRTVIAFDGKPAAEAYADALGIAVSDLEENFMRHPLGLVMADGEPYVRSPQQLRGSDVVFYCQVKQGVRMNVLSSRDIVADTRRDLERSIAELGSCSGIINFHCILRTVELLAKGQSEAYGDLFSGYPTLGFSTYGESYIGHINQTSTMLILG